MHRILFVCLGNICRSPTAEGIARAKVLARGIEGQVTVDSCGTGAWHVGEPPDQRAVKQALLCGYDISGLRARKFEAADFHRFDFIVAMDDDNFEVLNIHKAEQGTSALLVRCLDFHPTESGSVPDPYYGGLAGFEHMIDLLESAIDGLLDHLPAHH